MQHLDPDVLTQYALGRPDSTGDEHLSICARCQTDVDQLRAVVATARATTPEDRPEAPPPAVWDRVLAEIDADDDTRRRPGVTLLRRRRRETSRPGWPVTAAAAVVGLLAGVGITVAALGESENPPVVAAPDQPSTIAQARLGGLGEARATGSARVVATGQGRRLVVDVDGLTAERGFYEVWLLDRTASKLVSLGVLSGGTASLPVPDELDLTRFPVVDVSLEPLDGDPAHSKNSVVRGSLRA